MLAAIDTKPLRSAFGSFVTGVTVVTTHDASGTPVGVTANSFTSVSLDPPLVLVSLARSLRSFESFESCAHFAINVLSEKQNSICARFALAGTDKWEDLAPETGRHDMPLLAGRLAHFECEPWARYEGGDHLILVGRVLDYDIDPVASPLVCYRGAISAPFANTL